MDPRVPPDRGSALSRRSFLEGRVHGVKPVRDAAGRAIGPASGQPAVRSLFAGPQTKTFPIPSWSLSSPDPQLA